MRRAVPAVLLSLLAVSATDARAAQISVAEPRDRRCHATLLPAGTPGAAHRTQVAPGAGAVTATLEGAAGDWDLALFDAATARKLAASASSTAGELATAIVAGPRTVIAQACRLTTGAQRAELELAFTPITAAQALRTGRAQVVEVAVTDSKEAARLAAFGFDVTHQATDDAVEVVLPDTADADRLRALGYAFRATVTDLPALYRDVAARDRRSTNRALPSGRTTYRNYEDYGTEMKALAAQFPGHVKLFSLGNSLDGRPIEGVELAAGVGAPTDGRPTFLLGGVTHAREWPSGDTAMEFAIDMARTFAAGSDPRVTRLLTGTRVVVIPVFNPDGFVVSRQAGAASGNDAGDDAPQEATLAAALNDAGAYKRKNCRAANAAAMALPCAMRGSVGVDLNRAYGSYWGGEGSSPDPPTQQYRGPAPFTEPESLGLRRFAAARAVQTFISQHTFTDVGRILRQPGFDVEGDEVPPTIPDEAGMAKLGATMADATGYVSELGYATLGNITGPADDFLYYSQGTFGYTPELRGDNFHTSYASAVIGEYEGKGAKAGRGLREAYIAAGEQAADPADHAVLRGTAPAGSVLRLNKTMALKTSLDANGDGAIDTFDETLDLTLTVPADGRFTWHVNPSTRPLAPAKEAYALTCESAAGAVLERRSIVIDRGQQQELALACGAAAAPGVTPSAAARRVSLRISRPSFSARTVRRGRGVSLYARLSGGGLRRVTATIRDPRGKVLLSGRAATLPRSGRIRLTRRAVLRPVRVVVRVVGRDALGRRVTASVRSAIRR